MDGGPERRAISTLDANRRCGRWCA